MFRSPTLQTLTYFAYVIQNFKYALSDRKYEGVESYMMVNANRLRASEASRNGILSLASLALVNFIIYKVNEERTDGTDLSTKAVTQVSDHLTTPACSAN